MNGPESRESPAGGETPQLGQPDHVDIRSELLRAARALADPREVQATGGHEATSDLTVDEELVLHSVGWEPVELLSGVSMFSVPVGSWTWGRGEIGSATAAHMHAFSAAVARMHSECTKVGGHGVVGVQVEHTVRSHHISVELVGTAVRPASSAKAKATGEAPVFVSDLSARDFSLLHASGWHPVGLAVGASYVYAPRRSAKDAMQQKTQNVELTNFTEAMYSARELAMERMQKAAIDLRGSGIVEVKVGEGSLGFARHVVAFSAWGTVVRLVGQSHRYLQPVMVLPLDDANVGFGLQALRGS